MTLTKGIDVSVTRTTCLNFQFSFHNKSTGLTFTSNKNNSEHKQKIIKYKFQIHGIHLEPNENKILKISHIMRKPAFYKCQNKVADQLQGNQCHCFRCIDSTIPLFSNPKVSSFKPHSVAVQMGWCQSWPESLETEILMMQLK